MILWVIAMIKEIKLHLKDKKELSKELITANSKIYELEFKIDTLKRYIKNYIKHNKDDNIYELLTLLAILESK